MNNRPIDKKRNSGGVVRVGKNTEGAIVDMFELDGKLIIIKEKAIYESIMADKIDPERTNPILPNVIQKLILSHGSESEIVSRIFLTARKLLRSDFLVDGINTNKILLLTFELLQEIDVMEKEINDYLEAEKQVIIEYEKTNNNSILSIPSIDNLLTRCKTIFQKADHIEQILMEIITLFYPIDGLNKQSHFLNFIEMIKSKFGEKDYFYMFVKDSSNFFIITRALRNCLDHRLSNTIINNFELQANSNLIKPTIEIDYREIKLRRQPLSIFLPIITKNVLTIFETVIAFLCDKNIRHYYFPISVKFIPEESRTNRYIKFSFWTPIGDGGFFHQ